MRKPDFIIIGAQKASSTFIHNCLNNHPEIYLLPNEVPFFESPDYEESKIENLYSRFEKRNEKLVGFKRPNYIGKAEVPERIIKHLPDIKLIAVLRNPVDRAISALYHNMNYGFLPIDDPNKLLIKILDNEAISGYPRANEILEFGLYHKYLSKYEHYFKENRLYLTTLDEIKADKSGLITNLYRFLNVDSNFIPSNLDKRPQAVVYNLNRLKLLSKKNQFVYNYTSDKSRLEKKPGIMPRIIRKGFVYFDNLIMSKLYENQKTVSVDIREQLRIYYKSDIKFLTDKFDVNTSNWIN
jgi:hypothetical protein